MALTTFGAIMGFAADLVKQAEDRYRGFALNVNDPSLKGVLEDLSSEEAKLHGVIVRARRENVTEMILEPVSGLEQGDYELEVEGSEPKEDWEVIRASIVMAERERNFFRGASAKVPLPEVARLFRKVARAKEESVQKLQRFGLRVTSADKASI